MDDAPATVDYALRQNHGKALKLLRAALKQADLKIVSEIDISEVIRDHVDVRLAPCRLLYVCCPFVLLQAAVMDRSATGSFLLQLVISEHASETRIHLSSAAGPSTEGMPAAVRIPLSRLHRRVLDCLKAAGAQQVVCDNICHPIMAQVG